MVKQKIPAFQNRELTKCNKMLIKKISNMFLRDIPRGVAAGLVQVFSFLYLLLLWLLTAQLLGRAQLRLELLEDGQRLQLPTRPVV